MQEGLQLGPEEAAALRAALAAAELRADVAEARAASAEAKGSDDAALIAHLKLQIAKLQRAEYGQRSERGQRLLLRHCR
jgi:transposase